MTLSITSPSFICVCSTSLLKTLREKEKLLVTSNLSFSHSIFYLFGDFSVIMSNFSFFQSVFYPFDELFAIFIKFRIAVCKVFELGKVKYLSFGKGLIRMKIGWGLTSPLLPLLQYSVAVYHL